MTTPAAAELEVDGRSVRVSTLDRALWPAAGFTKAHLIDYVVRAAPVLLPHVAGRAVTLHRFPGGVGGPHFFQTRTPPHPEWVRTATMHFPRTGKTFEAPVVDDLASLVWAANLSAIELHPFLGPAHDQLTPSWVVFDLDPGAPAGLRDACSVALRVRSLLDAAGLASYPKTSGGKGVHVYVPVNTPTSYDLTKALARSVAATLSRDDPRGVLDRMARAERTGKVFVDWSQNDPGKSTVAPYSLRAMSAPSVSMPLTWDEVHDVAAGAPALTLHFTPAAALDRIDDVGDLFAPVLSTRQTLPVAG